MSFITATVSLSLCLLPISLSTLSLPLFLSTPFSHSHTNDSPFLSLSHCLSLLSIRSHSHQLFPLTSTRVSSLSLPLSSPPLPLNRRKNSVSFLLTPQKRVYKFFFFFFWVPLRVILIREERTAYINQHLSSWMI